MVVDWQAAKEEWIGLVNALLLPRLAEDRRLVDAHVMARRFELAVVRWRRSCDFRAVINEANELCAAAELLRDLRPDDRLRYEPRLSRTQKSIDFCVEWADGGRSWVDMKTVAPGWQDDDTAWTRVQRIAEEMPDNTHLLLDKSWSGAAIGGQWIKARWSFVQRTAELEAKVALLTESERGPVRLLLCSEGAWHKDDLEDFADFYRTGKPRADDWAQNAIALYMAERNIVFDRSITGFCYLERHHDEVAARHFAIDVRGPRLFAPA